MAVDTSSLPGVGRRGFIAGAAVVTADLAITTESARAVSSTTFAGELVRRDVWTLGTPWNAYTEAYARAVALMQSRAPDDPTSWYFQAAIHGTFVRPAHPSWNQCQHQSWHFLPWHRMFVYFMERIVRAAVAEVGGPDDWAMPYWNYATPFPGSTLPMAFRVPTLPDGSPNALYLPTRRSTAIMEGFELSTRVTDATKAMNRIPFAASADRAKTSFGGGILPPAQFAGALGMLETQPHNGVHTQVGSKSRASCTGGFMSAVPCAANDPIFFLHHANIDRLWNVWLGMGGGRANPTDGAWRNQTFTLYDETGQAVTLANSQVVDAAGQLGYVYA